VNSQNTNRLRLPFSLWCIHPVFSVTLLRPYNAETITECIQKDLLPLVIHDGVEEYKVKHILDSQMFQVKLKYLVCWKGYSVKEDEWRPVEDVQGLKWLIS